MNDSTKLIEDEEFYSNLSPEGKKIALQVQEVMHEVAELINDYPALDSPRYALRVAHAVLDATKTNVEEIKSGVET